MPTTGPRVKPAGIKSLKFRRPRHFVSLTASASVFAMSVALIFGGSATNATAASATVVQNTVSQVVDAAILSSSTGVNPVLYTPAEIAGWRAAAIGSGDRRTEWNGLIAHANADLSYIPSAPSVWSGQRSLLRADSDAALHLAIAYSVTGSLNYATAARRILLAWSKITTFKSDDNNWRLNFVFHHTSLVYAAGLIRSSTAWSTTDESTFRAYLKRTSTYGTLDRDNNWASWGVAHLSSVAAYLDDQILMTQAVTQYKRLINVQIKASPRGEMTDCYHLSYPNGERCKWYSNLSFNPLALTAETMQQWGYLHALTGFNLWDYRGSNGMGLQDAYLRLMALDAGQPGFPTQDSFSGGSSMYGALQLAERHWHSPFAANVFAGLKWAGDTWKYGGMVHPKLTLSVSL
jgi:hypothetical protein